MSTRTLCDAPGCDKARPAHHEDGYWSWVCVEASDDKDHGDFCSWSCLAMWATQRAMDRETTPVAGEGETNHE